MAKVKHPLFSLSASGSVGDAVTYTPTPDTKRREIDRRRGAVAYTAEYPGRIITGRATARLKPQSRGDLRRRKRGENIPADPVQAQKEARFTAARTIADWIVRNDLTVSTEDPNTADPPIRPWTDGLYFQRGENREERKFPGQPVGQSINIRRRITGTTTRHGFILRQLLTRRFFRFEITLTAWRNLSIAEAASWAPAGNAPWSELPAVFALPGGETFNRSFVNVWIQAAYLIPLFELPANWLNIGQRAAVWRSQFPRPLDDPAVVDWEQFLSSENDINRVEVTGW